MRQVVLVLSSSEYGLRVTMFLVWHLLIFSGLFFQLFQVNTESVLRIKVIMSVDWENLKKQEFTNIA